MDPLITIETVPIKIEYTEKESAHKTSVQSAKLNISRSDHSMTIQSDPISIPLTDTLELGSSDSQSSLTYTATAQYSGSGNLRMNVQMQDDAGDNTFQYQQFGRGIDNMMAYLPSSSGNKSRQIDNMQIDFDMSEYFSSNSAESAVDTSFYPPDLEFKVVETAKVIVKYVGGPIYVPPSADPEFDPSMAAEIAYFPRSADPDYEAETSQAYDSKSRLDLRA